LIAVFLFIFSKTFYPSQIPLASNPRQLSTPQTVVGLEKAKPVIVDMPPPPAIASVKVVEAVGKHTGTVIFLHVSIRFSSDHTIFLLTLIVLLHTRFTGSR